MKPVIIIVIAFVLLIPSSAFAQYDGGDSRTYDDPKCDSVCYRVEHRDVCNSITPLMDTQQCRIETAQANPVEPQIIDDKSTYQPKCAEGDILQNGVCIVSNPEPIYTKENSWFSWIFDLFNWIRF